MILIDLQTDFADGNFQKRCLFIGGTKETILLPSEILNSSPNFRSGEMDFKVEGPWNTEKYCRAPWLADKKNF